MFIVGWLVVCYVWWWFGSCFVVVPRVFLRAGFVVLVFVLGWRGGVGCFGWWCAAFFKGRRFSGILAANMPQTLYPSIIE